MQADPHEAVRLARRFEGQLERAARRHDACRPCTRRSRRSRGHLPPHVAGSAGMDPATHIAHLRGRRGPAARRVPRGTARRGRHLPAVGPRRPPPPRGGGPLVASGRRWSTDRATAFASSRARRLRRATSCRTGTRTTCAGWSRRCRRWTPTRIWPTWAGDRPGSFYPRRMAHETAVHRWDAVGGAIDPALAVDGIDEHLGLFAPLAPGDEPAEARHDPPPRHRRRRRVARDPGTRRHLATSTATPRATSRSAAPRATCCCGLEPGAGRRPLRGVRRRPPCSTCGAPASRSDDGIGSPRLP